MFSVSNIVLCLIAMDSLGVDLNAPASESSAIWRLTPSYHSSYR